MFVFVSVSVSGMHLAVIKFVAHSTASTDGVVANESLEVYSAVSGPLLGHHRVVSEGLLLVVRNDDYHLDWETVATTFG